MTSTILTTLTCPECGAPLERHVDRVERPVGSPVNGEILHRASTVEPFLACTGCEWAETVANLLARTV